MLTEAPICLEQIHDCTPPDALRHVAVLLTDRMIGSLFGRTMAEYGPRIAWRPSYDPVTPCICLLRVEGVPAQIVP